MIFSLIWVLPGSILIAIVCWVIMVSLRFISDYDGMTETTAIIIAAVTGVLCLVLWFVIGPIMGGVVTVAILPWVITCLALLLFMSIIVGGIASWVQGTGGIAPL